ncbi:type II secretion system F family protein [Microvirga sp. BT350]|uniref:Type II secretion system F family protein n=2 Tax=Microvirga alba TaxID=2791025 RepID=A0A931BT60_9HYPH|nr:type II secretion system F family protein [Microvirga alba]
MLSPELVPLFVALLAAVSVGGIAISMLYARAGRSEADRRLAAIAAWDGPMAGAAAFEDGGRKRSIETTLRNLEEQQKAKKGVKPSLTTRMRQADLSWSKKTYFVACLVASGVSFMVALTIFGVSPLPAMGFGLAGGLLLPHLYVNRRRTNRFKSFDAEFPNAVDVIVRGVKAGLPVVDCLRIIATEAKEPVRSEFRAILDDQTLGMPIDQAVQRFAERIPVAAANFFAIVIALQSRSGGSLSEALGNLSRVLRERKKMDGKIRAMSSEAKASAGIIGSLPVVVTCLLYLSAPDYITLLFTTLIGKLVLAAAAIWMGFGVLMMRKMINFDF